MSVPAAFFNCDKCDFGASSMVLWGVFNYKVADQLISVERSLGWCGECNTIRPIEVLPDRERMQEMQAKCGELHAHIENALTLLRSQQSWFGKLVGLKVRVPQHIQKKQDEFKSLSAKVQEDQLTLGAIEGRNSGPRCLLCGSERTSLLPKFPAPPEAEDFEEPEPAPAFIHPNCGGQVMVTHPVIRWSVQLKERTYDSEGRMLAERDHSFH